MLRHQRAPSTPTEDCKQLVLTWSALLFALRLQMHGHFLDTKAELPLQIRALFFPPQQGLLLSRPPLVTG